MSHRRAALLRMLTRAAVALLPIPHAAPRHALRDKRAPSHASQATPSASARLKALRPSTLSLPLPTAALSSSSRSSMATPPLLDELLELSPSSPAASPWPLLASSLRLASLLSSERSCHRAVVVRRSSRVSSAAPPSSPTSTAVPCSSSSTPLQASSFFSSELATPPSPSSAPSHATPPPRHGARRPGTAPPRAMPLRCGARATRLAGALFVACHRPRVRSCREYRGRAPRAAPPIRAPVESPSRCSSPRRAAARSSRSCHRTCPPRRHAGAREATSSNSRPSCQLRSTSELPVEPQLLHPCPRLSAAGRHCATPVRPLPCSPSPRASVRPALRASPGRGRSPVSCGEENKS
jgi:hypothetical protein